MKLWKAHQIVDILLNMRHRNAYMDVNCKLENKIVLPLIKLQIKMKVIKCNNVGVPRPNLITKLGGHLPCDNNDTVYVTKFLGIMTSPKLRSNWGGKVMLLPDRLVQVLQKLLVHVWPLQLTTGNRNYSSHRLANIEQTKVGKTPLWLYDDGGQNLEWTAREVPTAAIAHPPVL